MKLFSLSTLSLAALPFLAGCYVITINETVNTDMTIDQTMTVALSEEAYLLLQSSGEEGEESFNLAEQCGDEELEEFKSEADGFVWTRLTCTVVDERTIRYVGSLRVIDDNFLRSERLRDGSVRYTYEIVPLTDSAMSDFEESDEYDQLAGAMATSIFEIDRTVRMPGRITRADVGTLQRDGTLTLTTDDLDLIISRNSPAYVVSEVAARDASVSSSRSSSSSPYSDAFRERVCVRVAQYRRLPSVHERLVERVAKRFGFYCS